MELDSEIKKFLDHYQANHYPPYSSFSPVDLRKWYNEVFFKREKPKFIEVKKVLEKNIPNSSNQEIKCRIYYPEEEGLLPALMYFHGGGFVVRDNMDLYDQTCRMMCAGANCVVIAVDFRLAPEHPFPAAPEDCYTATCWMYDHAGELHIDVNRFGVWGESCGGNLATVVAMMARDRSYPKLSCQIIITAMLDYKFNTKSYIENGQGNYLLTQDSMQWFWNNYISDKNDIKNPYCAPCQAVDLTKLPIGIVIAVEYDPLRDENKQYADQLKSAGVDINYICYPDLIHGFFDLSAVSKQADKACQEIIELTKKILNT